MKYDPLFQHLLKQSHNRLAMTFGQIEELLHAPLPASARRHRPFWANDPAGHAHAKAWLDAGYRTEQVDMEGEQLVFVRAIKLEATGEGMADNNATYKHKDSHAQHPMIGALKGLLWIDPTLDLTMPALPQEEWDAAFKSKYDKQAE